MSFRVSKPLTKQQQRAHTALRKAFTLLELLLVIAIIASLAGLIINALNPAERLQEANEARYMTSANDIEKALEVYAVENGGNLPTAFNSLSYGYYEICKQGQSINCVNIDAIVPNYLSNIPEDNTDSTAVMSGYKLKYDPSKKEVEVYSNAEYTAFIENGSTLTDGLIGYWKMDEGSWNGTSGEVKDSSGNNNDGTANGGLSVIGGRYGNSGSFDGVDDHIPTVTNMVCSKNQTVVGWFKGSATGDSRTIFDMRSCGGRFLLYYRSNNTLQFFPHHATTTVVTSNTYTEDVWYYFSVTTREIDDNTTNARIYVNGILQNESNITYNPPGTPHKFYIGSTYNPANFFKGAIDDVRIYNRALSTDEINALYNNGAPPVAHWKFDEGSGTTAIDSSGNGNNGTLTNGPTWVTGRYGNGLSFDGVNDYVIMADNDNLDLGVNGFTVEHWIKTTQNASNTGIVRKWSGAEGWIFRLSGGEIPIYYIQDSGEVFSAYAGTAINNDQWHHVAYVAERSNGISLITYLNGNNINVRNSATFTGTISNSVYVDIGRHSSYFNGVLDDIRIYNYARTQAQIVKDMNNN